MNSSYQAPNRKYWKGRNSNISEYWYQCIALIDLIKETNLSADIAFIGYQCEEGVDRNQGRLGAKDGPNAIRRFLGGLPVHHKDLVLADCGDLVYNEEVELHTFQLQFAGHIARLLRNRIFPIALGGGHDISYAHFCGIHEAFHHQGKRFGIINFDAHFDLRQDERSTSGTPFLQILNQFGDHTKYLVLGIQKSSNPKSLFDTAHATGTRFISHERCRLPLMAENLQEIDQFHDDLDYLYLTIDMDGFSSAYSRGVSAPSPFGLSPDYVITVLKHLMKTGKVVALDFAETNPTFDIDQATSRLASKLIFEVVQSIEVES